MSPLSLFLIIGLLLLVLIGLVTRPSVRSFAGRQAGRFRKQTPPAPRANTGVTLIAGDGQEYDLASGAEPEDWAARDRAMGARRLLAVALFVLLAALAAAQIYRMMLAPAPDQFVVLVAPFREPGGAVTATGREVAAALAAELPTASGGRVVVRSLADPPADAAAALETLSRQGADALVWGEVAPGGMIDRETLRPLLAYQPSGAFAPYGWDGYAGRFVMPGAYALANAPLNGKAVLPNLLGALADYNAGRFDAAFTALGRLAGDYPALAPALPRALRGNILWARGDYQGAAAEYNRALAGLAPADAGPQGAPLYNNLGAILLDQGDDAGAAAAFNQAVAALKGQDLSALRYNLGLAWLRQGRYAEAASAIEIARSPALLAPSAPRTPLLLSLSGAYRLSGDFDRAQAALDQAAARVTPDADAVTPELRNLTASRLNAAITAERALLRMARAAGGSGPLLWELELSPPLPPRTLDDARADIRQSLDDTSVVARRWTRLSTTKDAAGESIGGQIALAQAARAQAQLRDRQRLDALIEIERGRAQGIQKPRGLMAIWAMIAGDRTPAGQGRRMLEQLLESQPGDVDSAILLGRDLLLTGDAPAAAAQFEKAAALATQRPEPPYGQGMSAAPADPARARQLLQQSITLDANFFPARQRLAELAEQATPPDWPTAIEQRRWLARNRPSRENTLALAEALRRSGPSSFAESERALLPLANQGDTAALLALSRLYQDGGDTQGARQMLQRTAQVAPGDPRAFYELGQMLEAEDKREDAEAQYKRALDADANHIPSRLALGHLYALTNRSAEASQQYNAALAAGAQDPEQLKQIGAVLLANGEYDPAATAYERALMVSKDDPELHHGLAQANLKRGRLDTAQSSEERALEIRNGAYPEALVGLGDIALAREKPADAAQQYDAAIKLNNSMPEAYIGLGRASGAQGNWAVAQAHFRDAIRVAPNSPEAHLWLGEALVRQGDPRGAIGEYAKAIELRPRYAEAYFGLAQAQMAAGQDDLARDNLLSAIRLRPNYTEALLLQGKLYEQQGDDNAAFDAYTRSIQSTKTLAEPSYRRGLLRMRRDQIDDAAADLERAIAIQPNFSEAHYWLGRAYLAQAKPKAARDEFKLAIEQRGGNYADARFYQGLAEEQLGERSDALASYQAALDQAGDSEWAGEARTALARLRQP